MNCSEIRNRIIYEAEDDPTAMTVLQDHVAGCAACNREYTGYQTLLQAYATESEPMGSPALGPRTKRDVPWKWIRAAAVILFALLGSMLLPEYPDPVPTTVEKQNTAHSWDYAVPSTYASFSEEESMDFKMKVDDLQNRILELRSRSTTDEF